MRILYVFLFGFLFFDGFNAVGQESFKALSWKQDVAYNSYLMRSVHQQYKDRSNELGVALQTKETMLRYRNDLRSRYRSILGNFPEKGKLNSKVLKVSQQEGFRVETIIFESLPKRYVTANLYLPDGKGPFAASLELCGHGMQGKIGSSEAILMALNGIAVLVVDPIGQGERVQLLDKNGQPATRGATTEHTLLNAGCNLVGSSLAAYEWWDNHRAIDYLETRPEIDKNRLGVYGSSGGGTQTAYLIGLEDRLKVASICSYFSQRERVLEQYGPSDGCQHVPGEGNSHIEISDWVTMFAPKPVLIMSGLYDFVDYWGALQASEELHKVYNIMGAGDAIKLFTAESGHGMPKIKREAVTTWFRTWLYNDPTPVVEDRSVKVPMDDMRCTDSGQVLATFKGAVSIPEYNEDLAYSFAEERNKFMEQDTIVIRQKILDLLGVSLPKEKIDPIQTGFSKKRTYDLYKYQIIRKGEIPIPCVVIVPETVGPKGKIVVRLNENGKDGILNDEVELLNSVNQGDIMVVADLRGYGETADPLDFNDTKYWNREYRNSMVSLHIGRTIVGQRVIDILSLIDFVSTNSIFPHTTIKLQANGTYGPVAVHAAYLDTRISETVISRSVKSYMEFIKNPMQRDVYTNVIPGVLKYYDLPDLVIKTGNDRVRFVD